MPAPDTRFPTYLKAFFGDMLTGMSGPLSVPFALAALWVSGRNQKILLAVWQSCVRCSLRIGFGKKERRDASARLTEQAESLTASFTERVEVMPKSVSGKNPQIYVEITDERGGLYKKTPFILHNRGEQDAYNVHIEVGEIRNGRIEIPDVPVVFAGKQITVIPKVEGVSILSMKNVIPLLMAEWNSYNSLNKETQYSS